jgi:hypothetical protein
MNCSLPDRFHAHVDELAGVAAVLLGAQQRARRAAERRAACGEEIGLETGVVVHDEDDLAAVVRARPQPVVGLLQRAGPPPVTAAGDHGERQPCCAHHLGGAVAAAVVDQHQMKTRVGLPQQAAHEFFGDLPAVVHRQNDVQHQRPALRSR